MIYGSIHTIPAKTYFSIFENADLMHLMFYGRGTYLPIQLTNSFDKIVEEYSNYDSSDKSNKIIDVSKNIESLSAQYESINMAVYHLKRRRDDDLETLVRSYKYTLTEDNFDTDLERIELESQGIHNKIARWQLKLPKPSEETSTKTTLEEVVMSYSAITGLQYKSSEISLADYSTLIRLGNNKIKELQKNGK